MKKKYILIGIIIILTSFFGYRYFSQEKESEEIVYTPYTASDKDAVTNTVEVFGSQMKMVSLLASKEEIQSDLETYYAPYSTYTLLQSWKNDPRLAPGSEVSSPYPDRIDVKDVDITDETAVVKGEVKEIVAGGETASTYPVSVQLQRVDGKWLITSFDK